MSMLALVVDPDAPHALRLGEVPEPTPKPHQVLVDVRHTSLNFGELSLARGGAEPGTVLGWDAAGVVAAAAADGTGPDVGSRVVTRGVHGWAQRQAASVHNLAVVPDSVDLASASALPVAAGTAFGALRAAGNLLGRRVLITGASGGVGRFAVQLAALAGAQVIASVGSAERGRGLTELGADQVVIGLDGIDSPVDVALDTVGGSQLVQAFALVAPGGNLQSIGWASGEPAVFGPYATVGPAKSLTSFTLRDKLADDLAVLVGLVASGKLVVEIGWRGPWTDFDAAVEALRSRTVAGKAVLDVTPYEAG